MISYVFEQLIDTSAQKSSNKCFKCSKLLNILRLIAYETCCPIIRLNWWGTKCKFKEQIFISKNNKSNNKVEG